MTERVIRYAKVSADRRPIPVFAGDPPEPIPAEWLAVSRGATPASTREGYVLYFLAKDGAVLELLQYETLDIALDQALAITGTPRTAWRACDLAGPHSDGIDPAQFA